MRWRLLLLPLLAATLQAGPASAQRSDETATVIYHMREGDSLYDLAQRHFRRIEDYVVVQRLNRIRNPRRIAIGRTVRIPKHLLRHEPVAARIISFRGNVQLRREGRLLAVSPGMAVREGDELATGANSFVSMGLPDRSAVALPSQSRVTVRRLRKMSLTGAVERLFSIEQGRAKAVVSPLGEEDEFHISTPISVSAVRGTEFRVRYDAAAERAATETLSGEVTMSSAGETSRDLPAGFGAVAAGAELSAPVSLLPAPRLVSPGEIQNERELAFALEPLAGAEAYRVQIAQDAGFLDVVAEAMTQTTEVRLPPIEDGTWFVRVAAIDGRGLEGMYETYGFQRRLNDISGTVAESRAGGYRQYLFRWRVMGDGERQYRFQLSRQEDGGDPIMDEVGLTEQHLVVTDLPPGTYYWRVMALQFADGEVHENWSPTERLTISADQ